MLNLTLEQAAQVIKAREILMRSAGRRNFPPLVLEMMKPRVVVHADRRVGKTEALLTAVCEREEGMAVIIAPTMNEVDEMRRRYRAGFLPLMNGRDPFFKTAHAITSFLPGQRIPIYCDEWWQFSPACRAALAASGLVAGAVGTIPGLGGCIEAFPLIGKGSGMHMAANGEEEALNDGW